MELYIKHENSETRTVTGEKAIKIAKKICTTYIALDCFNAGIALKVGKLTIIRKDICENTY